jgi:hypothetical protein
VENINMWMIIGSLLTFIIAGILYVYINNWIKKSQTFRKAKRNLNTFLDFAAFFSWFAPMTLWNPSGYSYFHIMQDYDFQGITIEFVVYIIPAAFLAVMAIWNFSSGWTASKIKGKLLYLVPLIISGMLGYSMNMLSTMENFIWQNWAWFILMHITGFMMWGSYFSRKERSKYAITRTDDVDDNEEIMNND